MIEEGVFNWEKIVTVIIGIVIVSTIYLVIYTNRRRKAKRKSVEREAELLRNNEQIGGK